MNHSPPHHITHAALHAQAEAAAGAPRAMVHRSIQYHAVYRASYGTCAFALVAAHGTLWANWYLPLSRVGAFALALCDVTAPLTLRQKMAAFDRFIEALRDINRQVMVASYRLIHTVQVLGPEAAAQDGAPFDLCQDYHVAMQVAATGIPLDPAIRLDLYRRHFRWEQQRVVGDVLQTCFDDFPWPLMRRLCLRPWVWFAYFRPGQSLNFRNFLDEEERVEKGLSAYARADRAGWHRVECRLRFALRCLGRRTEV